MSVGHSFVECLHVDNVVPVQIFISHLLPDAALSSLQSYEIELNKFTDIEPIATGIHTTVKKGIVPSFPPPPKNDNKGANQYKNSQIW